MVPGRGAVGDLFGLGLGPRSQRSLATFVFLLCSLTLVNPDCSCSQPTALFSATASPRQQTTFLVSLVAGSGRVSVLDGVELPVHGAHIWGFQVWSVLVKHLCS